MRLWLEIPEGVDLGVSKAIYDFLPHRNHSPGFTKVQIPDGKGPPLIKDLHPESAPDLLTDTRVFRLACELKFEELKILALKKLNNQHNSHEDLITVLEDVYSGFSNPHPDLQTWGRKFLTRNTGPSHPLDLATPYETSNL